MEIVLVFLLWSTFCERPLHNLLGDVFKCDAHSWEECLPKKDRIGGPSPTGSSYWADFKNCPYLFICIMLNV